VLDSGRRRALAEAVAEAIESHGDRLVLPLVTRLYLARHVGAP
jgi:hypothetical protein